MVMYLSELASQMPPCTPARMEVYSVENVNWELLSGGYQGTDVGKNSK